VRSALIRPRGGALSGRWAAWAAGILELVAAEPLAQRIASVADQIQEWAVEARWHACRPATWPGCPHHPDSHPLMAAVREGRAVWICPRAGDLVSDVGRLRAPQG
jgi:hypothetical protein